MDPTLLSNWLIRNTFSSNSFLDRKELSNFKREKGLSVSLVIPTLNEEDNIRRTLEIVCRDLVNPYRLIDECIVIDSGSIDKTRDICKEFDDDVKLYTIQEVLPHRGTFLGKGEGLWKSLYVSTGDIVIWIDADISNLHYGFVCGLLGPLLIREDIQFIKGFYKRPLSQGVTQPTSGEGGRVTEICARPLINLYWPDLSGMIQPLSGEYGGRRKCLETIAFTTGYGVELETLTNVYDKYGLLSIAQVDLIEKRHCSQDLAGLSRMSFGIMQVVARKMKTPYSQTIMVPHNQSSKSAICKIRNTGKTDCTVGGNCVPKFDVYEVVEQQRQPMAELEEYRAKFSKQFLTLIQ